MRVFWHMFMRLAPIDFSVGAGATVAWFLMLEVESPGATAGVVAALYLLHLIGWAVYLHLILRPLRAWGAAGDSCSQELLLAADRSAERLPPNFALVYSLTWFVYFGGVALVGWSIPGLLSIGKSELVSSAFQVTSATFCAPVLVLAFTRYLLEDTQVRIAVELDKRGLGLSRAPVSMSALLTRIVLCMIIGPIFWYVGMTYLALSTGARDVAMVEQQEAVRRSAERVRRGESPLFAEHEIVGRSELPSLLALSDALDESGEPFAVIDRRTEQVSAAAAVDEHSWVVSQVSVEFDASPFWIGLVAYMFSTAAWALLAITGTTRAVFQPLRRLLGLVERVVEHGELHEAGRAPVLRRDEVGSLTIEINHMFALLEELAGAASAVAAGDLRVDIAGRGPLQDAFRSMLTRLTELVGQIREASLGLASAAIEIQATTEAQESVSSIQSEEAHDVSRFVAALAEAAEGIASAAKVVLSDAEQGRAHADQVRERLSELSQHMAGVGELLELIRDIANRSDLLALNGSLEATRAGDAGRGFALVAAEMRRLAERVTRAVGDMRTLTENIEASSASTLAATQNNRELADRTAAAAEQIVELTGQQRRETARVSGNAEQIANSVAQSVTTTSQTRATADGLRNQARELEALISQFETKGPSQDS